MDDLMKIDAATKTELEAAAFRRLVAHLQEKTDIQNIDLMTTGGFCRNCLSRWMREAAAERGVDLDLDAARMMVYGMAYGDWKAQYQTGPKVAVAPEHDNDCPAC